MRRTLRRLAEVLLVGVLVNWMWFPIFREPRWIVRKASPIARWLLASAQVIVLLGPFRP